MAANNMRQLIGQLESGYYGGTKVTISKEGMDAITAEFNAEQERKRRGLMSDAYNLDCSRNPPSRPYQDEQAALLRVELNRQLAKAGLPQAPVYERKPDNGNRNRRTDKPAEKVSDPVNQPAHYKAHPAGIECIQVTEHMGFNIGNAVKYLWRCDLKNDAIEDLEKSIWYIRREIEKRKKAA